MNRAELRKFQELAGEGDQTWVTGSTGEVTNQNWYMVYFPVATTIRSIKIGGVADPEALLTPRVMAAGTTLYNVEAIHLQTSGWAVCYSEPA